MPTDPIQQDPPKPQKQRPLVYQRPLTEVPVWPRWFFPTVIIFIAGVLMGWILWGGGFGQ